MATTEQPSVQIDLRTFFNQYKHAYADAYKLEKTDMLPPYSADDIPSTQLPDQFAQYLVEVSRELLTGAIPTGPIFDISVNTNITGNFTADNDSYDGCLMIGTHIPHQCFHVIVTDTYHADYGAIYLNVPNRKMKVKAWKDFTTYITTFIMKVSEEVSKKKNNNE